MTPMAKRSAYGMGTVNERNGRFQVTVSLGTDSSSKRIRRSHTDNSVDEAREWTRGALSYECSRGRWPCLGGHSRH